MQFTVPDSWRIVALFVALVYRKVHACASEMKERAYNNFVSMVPSCIIKAGRSDESWVYVNVIVGNA